MEQDPAARRAIAKAARRLLPFLCLCYAVNFLDRVNVGFAALDMNEDLGLSPSIFGTGAGIFFVGYLLFEIPSNLALQRFGARIWIARIMVSWGLIAAAMALVSGPVSFYVMRFLLGVAEAGFFPGIILYLTYWFPARERARIVSLFMAAVPLATVVGGPVSGALLALHGLGGLKGWHWLFVIEGLPAVLLGIAAYFLLDDKPDQARWLSTDERDALSRLLSAEAKATREVGYHALGDALTRPRVLVLALIYFCIVVGLYGIGFWMPQVIQTFGLNPLEIGFLTAIPYLFAAFGMVLWGRNSDATGERIWHIALPLLVGGAAFAWSAMSLPLGLTMVALTLAALGIYAAIGTFWSLPTAILTGTGAAAGLALVNAVGNLGGLAGPAIVGVLKQANGDFILALLFLAGALLLGAGITLLFGRVAWITSPTGRGRPQRGRVRGQDFRRSHPSRHTTCARASLAQNRGGKPSPPRGEEVLVASPGMTKRVDMDDETPNKATRRTLLAGMALMAAASALSPRAKAGGDMKHVVLLGDSIFDNKRYVGEKPDVMDELKADLPAGWTASLNALDGSTTFDIAGQLKRLPPDATHLVVSVGGNDALKHKDLLDEKASSVAEVLDKLGGIRAEFQANYRAMLDGLLSVELPAAVCTIYEARYKDPDTHRIAATGLSVFNDIITREAFARGLPLIDLRLIVTQDDDYANDVEPSSKGGAKIARAIADLVTTDDFKRKRSVVFAG